MRIIDSSNLIDALRNRGRRIASEKTGSMKFDEGTKNDFYKRDRDERRSSKKKDRRDRYCLNEAFFLSKQEYPNDKNDRTRYVDDSKTS